VEFEERGRLQERLCRTIILRPDRVKAGGSRILIPFDFSNTIKTVEELPMNFM
jgi:hypothetical protein